MRLLEEFEEEEIIVDDSSDDSSNFEESKDDESNDEEDFQDDEVQEDDNNENEENEVVDEPEQIEDDDVLPDEIDEEIENIEKANDEDIDVIEEVISRPDVVDEDFDYLVQMISAYLEENSVATYSVEMEDDSTESNGHYEYEDFSVNGVQFKDNEFFTYTFSLVYHQQRGSTWYGPYQRIQFNFYDDLFIDSLIVYSEKTVSSISPFSCSSSNMGTLTYNTPSSSVKFSATFSDIGDVSDSSLNRVLQVGRGGSSYAPSTSVISAVSSTYLLTDSSTFDLVGKRKIWLEDEVPDSPTEGVTVDMSSVNNNLILNNVSSVFLLGSIAGILLGFGFWIKIRSF